MTSSARRRVLFGFLAVAIACVAAVGALLAVDLYLHHRLVRSAGLNVWGYRGPAVAAKHPGEIRVLVLGGSTVFGYGVTWDKAFPALLERQLNRTARDERRFTVANLGYHNEGAYSFRFTLADYAALQPDVVVLYEGYNDLMGDGNGGNPQVFRHDSIVFRATGYFPILPLVLREKAMAMRAGGSVDAAYARDGRTVFKPGLAARATSSALEAAADISDSLERQFARLAGEPLSARTPSGDSGCAFPWSMYCRDVAAAVDFALARGWRVVFVAQPLLTTEHARERHMSQQQAVAAMVRTRYADRRDVRYVDLGSAIDLHDGALAFDGMHLTADGNALVAERLAPEIARAAGSGGSVH
jgi:lysophospholipase L1-like esterase